MVLILGIFVTGISIGSLSYYSISLIENYPDTEILFAGETIESFSSITGLVEIDFSRDFFLGARAIPSGSQIILSLISEEGEEIIIAPLEETLFEKLSNIKPGFYKLEVSSFSPEPSEVYVVLTAHDMRENFETISELAGYLVLGFVLIIPGIILMIISGIFLIVTKKRDHKKNS